MASEIPGLGSKTEQSLQRIQEQYPLPDSRKGIVQAVESILNKGGVQKFTLQLGQPIRVERLVRAGESVLPVEPLEDDLYFAARNAEIRDFDASADTSDRALLKAFRAAREAKAVPHSFVTFSRIAFARWLGLQATDPMTDVYGLDVVAHKDVPEDVLLFVCMKAEEPDIIAFTLKILMEE